MVREERRHRDLARRRAKYAERMAMADEELRNRRREQHKAWYRQDLERARAGVRHRMRKLREKRYDQGLDANGRPRPESFQPWNRGGKTRGRYVEHGRKRGSVRLPDTDHQERPR